MANWLNYRLFILIFPICFSFYKNNENTNKWGFVGHKSINRLAVFTLPPELFGFYKAHIDYITDHSVDPDKRRYLVDGEDICHYIDIDHYYVKDSNVFDIVPKYWNQAVLKYSEDTLKTYGVVPWHVVLMKNKLQKAFETKNIDLILKYSSEIGHYIADAHVPLHTTENYNGQLTNQKGIHGLWESRLVELYKDNYNYFVGRANYLSNPTLDIWEAIRNSHLALDTVFKAEKELTLQFGDAQKYTFEQRGNQTIKTYSVPFSKAYHDQLNGMVERRMKAAILCVGSFWYTAWVDAGQPDLSNLIQTQPSDSLKLELINLEKQAHHSKHKRNCD
jgi:hypothetical protein